ncbi:MAG: PD-(D/E)XK nuclease family protein, partial [Rothia mucilaginosa]
PVTLVHGTVVDPANLPPAPDEVALLEELERYPLDADELTPEQAEARANAQATYVEQVQRYAWALVEVMAPALARDWQLAAPHTRARTVAENCSRLNLPVPEWAVKSAEWEARDEAQPLDPGFSPTVAAALPIEVRGQFAQKNYEDRNPNLGAVLTAMWPFDPLERPVIWRWASDDALTQGTEAMLRRGQHENLQREIAINSSSRREAVERAALAVELAVGEGDPHRGAEVAGESVTYPAPGSATAATSEPAVHGASAIPEPLRQQAVDWEREADLLLLMMGQTDPVLTEQLPGHLSASTFIRLSEDPQGTVHQLMRPVPQRPSRAATIGTAVHALIEEHFGVAPTADPLEAPEAEDTVGVDLPGSTASASTTSAAPADPADLQEQALGESSDEFTFEDAYEESESELEASVQRLWERFANSEWGSDEWKERIWAVEYPVETHVEGVSLRGRIDAVFRTEDEDGERWVLVDWKSGSRPKMA